MAAALVVLVGGRWLAVHSVNQLWAQAVGIGPTHSDIAGLRLVLIATAFVGASVWCLGNLYLVYRSIGSVHVPRRLANLEFVEAVPSRYLLTVVILIGIILALLLSHRSGNWWQTRALADYPPLGVTDPVLGRDLSYYVFHLPWQRTVHGFVTVASGTMLAVTAILYAAVGAITWHERKLHVMDVARMHLGALLAVFALALFWGYRLEPLEYVAGIHDVPADAVLVEVRLPTARLLASLALVVAGASLLWVWSRRSSLVIVGWGVLAVVSFAGHYIVPAFAGAARTPEELVVPEFDSARAELTSLAYGLPVRERELSDRRQDVGNPAALIRGLERAPLWDASWVTVFLNRTARFGPAERASRAELGVYPSPSGEPVPLYLSVRQIDLAGSEAIREALTWEKVHGPELGFASGALAVAAHQVSETGFPLFVTDIGHPDSTVQLVSDVRLANPELAFAPDAADFVVAPKDAATVGVPAGGLLRRLALAWVLQSPRLALSRSVSRTDLVLWHRDVSRRLERFAPFAAFGRAYPVVARGSILWLADGYITGESFPLAPRAAFRGRKVRALGAGLIGVVDARTGETRVYLRPDADIMSAAWQSLAPGVVRPAAQFPADLLRAVRYPAELFDVQGELVARGLGLPGSLEPGARSARSPGVRAARAAWWVGPVPWDTAVVLRRVVILERGSPPVVAAVLDGRVYEGALRLDVARGDRGDRIPGPSEAARRLAELWPPDTLVAEGPVRAALAGDQVLALKSHYSVPGDLTVPPRLLGVAAVWGSRAARGRSFDDALRSLLAQPPPPPAASEDWIAAAEWFRRLDEARRSGDWTAFGRAYDALRRILSGRGDTAQ